MLEPSHFLALSEMSVASDDVGTTVREIEQHMEKVQALTVPLQVDMGVGMNWRDLE